MTQKDKEQACKKCGRVFGSVRCFDVDCPYNTPKNNQHLVMVCAKKDPLFFINH